MITELELVGRLILAFLLGGAIGWQREKAKRPAGFRTHTLVCIGAALTMLLSMYGFEEFATVNKDPARLAAQVVSGIGFLGAGTILRDGFTIAGLTTAASLWVVACIGLAIGAGYYLAAVVSTALIFITITGCLEKYIFKDHEHK